MYSSLRGVTSLAARHPRDWIIQKTKNKITAIFPTCTPEMTFFTNNSASLGPCGFLWRALLKVRALQLAWQECRTVPWGSAAASHLRLIASCPRRGHRTGTRTIANRHAQPPSGRPSPSSVSGGILLQRPFFCFARDQRQRE